MVGHIETYGRQLHRKDSPSCPPTRSSRSRPTARCGQQSASWSSPAAGQVRIRVEACGICHTDTFSVQPHDPARGHRVPGHEIVGVIDAVGAGVEGWSAGQRVGVGFLGGHCGVVRVLPARQLRRVHQPAVDRDDRRRRLRGGGVRAGHRPGRDPGRADRRSRPPRCCARGSPPSTRCSRRTRGPGDLVAIQGIGGLGHLGIQYAAKMGLRVAAIARGTAKEPLARELGAHHYIDSAATDPGEELSKLGGAQVVIATAAGGDIVAPAQRAAPAAGSSSSSARLTSRSTWPRCSSSSATSGVRGSLTGSAIENEDNLRFAVSQDVRAMTETRPAERRGRRVRPHGPRRRPLPRRAHRLTEQVQPQALRTAKPAAGRARPAAPTPPRNGRRRQPPALTAPSVPGQ